MNVTLFNFEGREFHALLVGGDAHFLAADVCLVLGIRKYRDALAKLDPDERGLIEVDTPGGPQNVASVNESGLYTLILRSREATTPGTLPHRFRRWVTGEVLPTIRKTGGYGEARAAVNLRDPSQMLQVTTQLAELLREREGEVAILRPRAEAFLRIADGSASMTITEAAKTLQIPPRQLGIVLRDRRWVYRRQQGKSWLAYQSRIEAGHLEHKITELRGEAHDPALPGRFVSQVRIIAKGVARLADLLKTDPAAGAAVRQAGLPLAPTSAPAA